MNLKHIKSATVALIVLMSTMAVGVTIPNDENIHAKRSPMQTQWPMFQCDTNNTGKSYASVGYSVPEVEWEFDTGGGVYSSPIIDENGTVYFGSDDNNFYAVYKNGTQKWVQNGISYRRNAAAVADNGTIYCSDGDHLLSLDSTDGYLNWALDLGFDILGSPVISDDGTIYVPAGDYIYAVKSGGSGWFWRFNIGGLTECSPAIGPDGKIYIGSNYGKLYCLFPDGSPDWAYPAMGTIRSSPTIADHPGVGPGYRIYFGAEDGSQGKLYALDESGALIWEYDAYDPVYNSPVVDTDNSKYDAIYLTCDDTLIKIIDDGNNYGEDWMGGGRGVISSSPAMSQDDRVIFTDSEGYVYSIDSQRNLIFDIQVDLNIQESSPAIDSEGYIYVGTTEGKLVKIGPDEPDIISVYPEEGDDTVSVLEREIPVVFDQTMDTSVEPYLNQTGGGDILPLNFQGWIDTNVNEDTAVWTHQDFLPGRTYTYQIEGYENPDGLSNQPFRWNFSTFSWPSFNGDEENTACSRYYSTDVQSTPEWIFDVGDEVYSSPVIGYNETIYIGTNNSGFFSVNRTGSQSWCFTECGKIKSSAAQDGNYSDYTIYLTSEDCCIYALSPEGGEKWSFPTGGAVESSPVLGANGTIYFGSKDIKLYAINPDGSKRWDFQAESEITSTPAIDKSGTIYFGSLDRYVYAVNSDGTLKWKYLTDDDVHSSPTVAGDGTVYIGSDDQKLYALNSDGSEKWNYSTAGKVRSSPSIASDGTVYLGSSSGTLYGVNPNGTEKWTYDTGAAFCTSPALGSKGNIFFGGGNGFIYSLGSDGNLNWKDDTGANISSKPIIGTRGSVYVVNQAGKLFKYPNRPIPEVIEYTPVNDDYHGVAVDITVVFDEEMDPLLEPNILVLNGTDTGGWNFQGWSSTYMSTDTATWSHNLWKANEMITLEVSGQKSRYGFEGPSHSWDFNTFTWPSFGRGMDRKSTSSYSTSGILYPKEVWSYPTYDMVTSSPVFGLDSNIYVGSDDEKIYALDQNGTKLWNYNVIGKIRGTPTVDHGGNILVGSNYQGLKAINSEGDLLWNFGTGGVATSPIIDNQGSIYFGSRNGYFYSLYSNGTERWSMDTGSAILSSPAIGLYDKIYFGTNGNDLYSIHPNGSVDWVYPVGAPVRTTPSIADDGTVYFGADDCNFYALNTDGTLRWNFATEGSIRSSPAVDDDGTIYFGNDAGAFYALNPDGSLRWNASINSSIKSSPSVCSEGIVYFGCDDGYVYSYSPSGELNWKFLTGGEVRSSPLLTENALFIGSSDKKLYKISDSPPSVHGTTPKNGLIDVPEDKNIEIVFDEPMNISVTPELNQLYGYDPGNWSFSGWSSTRLDNDTATWSHGNWSEGSNIMMEVVNYSDSTDQEGDPYQWSFTVYTPDPKVITTDPSMGQEDSDVSQDVKVIFNKTMDATKTPILSQIDGYDPDGWTFQGWSSTNVSDDTATWQHNDWLGGDEIELLLTDYYGSYGKKGVDYSWTFKTGYLTANVVNTTPSQGSSDSSDDQEVIVVFDETMDTGITPKIEQTSGADPGSWVFHGWSQTTLPNDTATWTHDKWELGDSITLEISDFKDENGNHYLPYQWSFNVSTVDSSKPLVRTVYPEDESKILIYHDRYEVHVLFDESMDPAYTPTLTLSEGTEPTSFYFDRWEEQEHPEDTAIWRHDGWQHGENVTLNLDNYRDDGGNIGDPYSWTFEVLNDSLNPWPSFRQNPRNTGKSIYNTSGLSTVEVEWNYSTNMKIRSTPAVGFVEDKMNIIFGSYNGYIYSVKENDYLDNQEGNIVRAREPKLLWKENLGSAVTSSPLLSDEGKIYVGTYDGKLVEIYNETFYAPQNISVFDYFNNTDFDPTIWDSNYTIGDPVIDDVGLNEPSSPYSARLDGVEDSFASIEYDTTDHTEIEISFWYELGGGGDPPESDDSLKLEYMNSTGSWVEVWSVEGDGDSHTEYEFVNISIKDQEAFHPNFRYRFRSICIWGGPDDFFVDDVHFNLYTNKSDYNYTIMKEFVTEEPIYSSPIHSAEGNILFGSYDGKLYCLNPDMTLNWSYQTGDSIYSSPAEWSDGTVYIASFDGKMYSLYDDGSLRWSYDTGSPIYSSPVLTDLGDVVFTSNDNYLYYLNSDGTLK